MGSPDPKPIRRFSLCVLCVPASLREAFPEGRGFRSTAENLTQRRRDAEVDSIKKDGG